jgi:hypothetical protein
MQVLSERVNMAYLVVRKNHWGKGDTLAEAKKKYREASGLPAGAQAAVYEIPADYYIDELGVGHGSAEAKLISGSDARRT